MIKKYKRIGVFLVMLLALWIVKGAECRVERVEDGTYTLSVSCTVDIGYETLESPVQEFSQNITELAPAEEDTGEEAQPYYGHKWKVDPIFAVCGMVLIAGAITILIGCIRSRNV